MLYKFVLEFCHAVPFLNQSAQNESAVKHQSKILHFLTPSKNRGGLVEMSARTIGATPRF